MAFLRHCILPLLLCHLCVLCRGQTPATVEQQCANMEGECTHCVCCCYRSGLDLMRYRPNADCQCESELAPGFIVAMVLLGISLLTSLLSGCYFAGKLPVTPFKDPRELPSVELVPMQGQST